MGNTPPFQACCVRGSSKADPAKDVSHDEKLPPSLNPIQISPNSFQASENPIESQKKSESNENPLKNRKSNENTEINSKIIDKAIYNDPSFKYQDGDLFGFGAHGKIYECMDIEEGKFYACKYINCQKDSRRRVSLYLDKKLLEISHENLINYLEVSEIPHNNEVIMVISSWISGGGLNKLLLNVKILDEKICKLCVKQTLEGLDYLNKNGYGHSNLKPSNIMFETNGVIKLTDFFTISKKLIIQTPENQLETLNSICYQAPEVLVNGKKSLKSDIWSLGCILLEMLTGTKPWGDNYKEMNFITDEIKNGKIPYIPEILSMSAQNFLKRTLQIDENNRPTSFELINDPFLLDLNDKEEVVMSKTIDNEQLKIIKSLFMNETGQKKGDHDLAMAKNVFYNRLYMKTFIKSNELEGKKNKGLGVMRESVRNIRKKNEEERKICEEELAEMFLETE